MLTRWTIAIAIVAFAGAYAAKLRVSHATAGAPPRLEELSRSVGGWVGEDVRVRDRADEVLGADAALRRRYRGGDGSEVGLFVSYFSGERDNKGIHSPQLCLPGEGWTMALVERPKLQASSGTRKVTRLKLRRGERNEEVIYWMQTQGGTIASEYGLKWDQIKQALRGRSVEAAFIRYNAALSESTQMRELIDLLDPHLSEILADAELK